MYDKLTKNRGVNGHSISNFELKSQITRCTHWSVHKIVHCLLVIGILNLYTSIETHSGVQLTYVTYGRKYDVGEVLSLCLSQKSREGDMRKSYH